MSTPPRDEPLSMSVHSLPDPQQAAQATPPPMGRWKLVAIAVLCSLPVAAAYFAYFVVRPQGQAAIGQLVTPVREVAQLQALGADGRTVPLAQLKGQWLLVGVSSQACADDCAQRIFLHRQLREMLGKDRERVERVWLYQGDAPDAGGNAAAIKDATVLRVQPEVFQQWFEVPAGTSLEDFLFVVDPLGNTMMRLPARFSSADAAKARRDLERLLRASAAWDGPGRQ